MGRYIRSNMAFSIAFITLTISLCSQITLINGLGTNCDIVCGDVLEGIVGFDETKTLDFKLGFDATKIKINLCFNCTDFETIVDLIDNDGRTILATDVNGCGGLGSPSFLDYNPGLIAGDYTINISNIIS